MERIGYLQLASANEASTRNEHTQVPFNLNLFAELNWRKVSSSAAIHLLSVALTLALLSIAERALALQKVGSSGPQISNIQRCLSNLGYYNGPVTGKFASLTQNAVIRFQQANRLPTDGVVGARTQQLLQSQCQSRRPGGSVSSGLQPGSSGQAVTRLQQDLGRLGYFNGPITGNFGSETQQAVIKFQQARGIRPDGVVGARTEEAIRIVLSRNNPTVGVGGDSLPNALNLGDSSPQVRELQQDLQQLGYFRVNPTDYFGPTTQEAVARFQQDNRIVPSGIADSQTLGAITIALREQSYGQNSEQSSVVQNSGQSYGQSYGQSSVVQSSVVQSYGCSTATGDICQGERSQRVTVVQQRLQNLGFFRGDTFGFYGPATRDAVIQFQRYSGLETTGSVNFQTWQALGLTNNGNNSTELNTTKENRYVVIIPISRNETLNEVRQYIPEAFRAESRLGPYVNAGQFRERSQAEDLSKWLRSRGLDARVEYF
ncbi:peptidoglycan-binding domain-containing protein [Brasilonema bromeliae]|uniref:Peptidoglycan-binding protein n=1 Tax=Brasilonema bromeliae SPC951 TaxID=385972 RepID=A0ABX1P6U7_9CYAN|nr:peptidoglycan-binding protein [Brasilonema bromeliae]NMG19426.1 peptidoglycan-binding protein [Brasilonema bromeliae SPC951]